MATYIPDATVVTEPTDDRKASSMGLEFRTLKSYIQSVVIISLNSNTAAISGKVAKAGDEMSGNLYVKPVGSNVEVGAIRSAIGFQTGFHLGTQGDAQIWSMFQPPGSSSFQINDTTGPAFGMVAGTHHARFYGAELAAANFTLAGQSTADGGTYGFYNGNGPGMQLFGTAYGSGVSGQVRFLTAAAVVGAVQSAAGNWSFPNTVNANISGNSATTSYVDWTSVAGRPTNLSQFVNDIGLGGGGLASFQGRTASAAVLLSADVTGSLGYTPYNSSNPANYTTLAAVGAAGYQTSSGSVASAATATNAANAINVTAGGTVNTGTVTSSSSITAAGRVEGNGGGGNGLGKITVSTSGPSGGAQGDIWFQVPP